MKKRGRVKQVILDSVTLLIDCINRTTWATEESADEFKRIMHFEEVLLIFFCWNKEVHEGHGGLKMSSALIDNSSDFASHA